MPNWKKVIVSGSSAELTTLKLTGTSGQSSEATSLMINGDGTIGTRELGSNAFNSNTYNNYSLPLAASGTRGGVKIGFTESGKNYPVELSSEKMFVNVPWTDNNTTYSVGDGGLTQKNFTTTLKNKLDGIAASANNFSIAVGVDSGEGVGVSSGGTVNLIGGTNVTLSQDGETGAVTITSTDNNTTYSVGDGGLTQKNFTTTLKNKLDGIAASATNVTNNNQLDNGAGYTTNTGTVTQVSTGAGLDGSFTTSGTITLDLSELTDMTANVVPTTDEVILLDNGAERRKRFSEIFGSNAYNSTTIPTNNNQLTNGAGYITSYTDTNTVDMGDGFIIANSDGEDQFTITENEEVRFAGSGATSVAFDAETQKVTISSTDNNTTYSVGDGGLTQKNFTSTLKTKLDGIAASATNVTNNNQLTNGAGYITSFTNTVDMGDGFKIANSAGTDQFTVTENEEIRFAGSGATSVAFDSSTQKVTISSTDNNTTYSVGDGGLTQKNFTTTLKNKLDGIAASANNYSMGIGIDGGEASSVTSGNSIDLVGGSNVSLVQDGNSITISSTDTNTDTNTVTQIRRDNGGTYRTGNINLVGGTNVTISETSTGVFNISSTDTNTDTNTFRTVKANDGETTSTLGDSETLEIKAGTNVSLTESAGVITISSTDTNTDTNTTYSAGGGLSLSGTTFSNAGVTSIVAGTDITISGGTGIVTINAASQTDQNFTNADHTKLNGIATSANNYSFGVTVDGDEEAGVTIGNGSNLDISAGSNVSLSQNAETGAITISSTDTNTDTNTTYSAGTGIDLTGTTFSHDNTSGQNSVNNSGNTVIQDVTLDTYGHVTALASKTLSIPSNNNELDNGAGYTTNSGTVTGTGVSNRIARWSGTSAISSVSDLTFDGVTLVAGTDGSTGGRVRTGDGSVSSPAFSFVGDNNTGFYCSTTDTIAATTGGTQRLTINSNGMKVNNGALGVNVNASTTNGRIDASNDIVAYSSDKRLKENIKVIETPLDKLDKLSGFTYNWNEKANKIAGFDKEESMVGVFAQDVESVLPEAVKRAPFDNDGEDGSKSGENYLTVQYEKLVPLLIESIKELKSEIEELKRGK